ncbi:hypothetical protein F6X37_12830 [Paraburkholderia sp. 31.1]|uniref:hypothetical protein n=1 Tax=Paraburkholderia sp. 31.1 TaxID=2615205 RepID=UPI001655BF67|nr:hypothetical protein [Paraburkholderia sp. 31.1]MBC8722455.1 hypothetical protein [Paraburkholderia sp. 31.1]
MAHEIDIHDGSVRLNGGPLLSRDARVQQLRAMGLSINQVFEMQTGWRFLTSGPYTLLGKSANLALAFFNDELKRVHFAMSDSGATTPDQIRHLHDTLLLTEFGAPQVQDSRKTMYVFPWGTIVSAFDPRGGQSEIVLTWQ